VGGKFFLGQAQGAANDFRRRRPLHPLKIVGGQGCASLSARAAASMALGVMDLSVFFEVVVLLILGCPSS